MTKTTREWLAPMQILSDIKRAYGSPEAQRVLLLLCSRCDIFAISPREAISL